MGAAPRGLFGLFRRSPAWSEVVYWALDLELSGLKPKTDEILAVGMVPIRDGSIRWGERYYSLVRPADPALISPAGIPAHHILPGELDGAPPVGEVLPEIDRRLEEGVLLLHFASIDVTFLERAHQQSGQKWPRPTVIDTVELLARVHEREHYLSPHPVELPTQLEAARAKFGLPPHEAHHALADALATAELFLALRARLDARTLKELR